MAGNSRPISTAMMAITTNSSISVKPVRTLCDLLFCDTRVTPVRHFGFPRQPSGGRSPLDCRDKMNDSVALPFTPTPLSHGERSLSHRHSLSVQYGQVG